MMAPMAQAILFYTSPIEDYRAISSRLLFIAVRCIERIGDTSSGFDQIA